MSGEPPSFKKRSKEHHKGCHAKGKTYERKIIKDFSRMDLASEVLAMPWFCFSDLNGLGSCQPDILFITKTFIVIGEIKLTQTVSAWSQLENLYQPVCELHYGKPCYTLQICKNLRYDPPNLVESIAEFIDQPKPGLWTLHQPV